MAKKGLPKKYAKLGFKKGWAAYKAAKRKTKATRKTTRKVQKPTRRKPMARRKKTRRKKSKKITDLEELVMLDSVNLIVDSRHIPESITEGYYMAYITGDRLKTAPERIQRNLHNPELMKQAAGQYAGYKIAKEVGKMVGLTQKLNNRLMKLTRGRFGL